VDTQRRNWIFGAISLSVGLGGYTHASAAAIDTDALEAFNVGNWALAARLAEAKADEENLVFAARAIATQISLQRPSTCSARTMSGFRRLIDLAAARNPHNVQAKLLDAVYDLFRARQIGPVRAFVDGAATRGKQKLEVIIRTSPNNAEAHALLGSWHYEALRFSNQRTAGLIGASELLGRQAFARARVIAPRDTSIPFLEANGILLLNPRENAEDAIKALGVVVGAGTLNQLQRIIKGRAQRLLILLLAQDYTGATNLVLSWL
jgi:hypothetical protein